MGDAPRPSTSRLNPVKVYGSGASRPATRKAASPVLAGVLVGIFAAVARSAHEPNASLGPTAAALAVGSLILAKMLIVEFAAPAILRKEFLQDRYATAAAFLADMRIHQSFSPEVEAAVELRDSQPDALSEGQQSELVQHLESEAVARSAAATPAERERVVGLAVKGVLDAMGFVGVLKKSFGFWDVLWFGLAISSAYKVAQRG